jgi:molybdopterin-binding protein
MKPNDVVYTRDNLKGKVKKVFRGTDNVIVEFIVQIDTKRKIRVTSKMPRQSLRISGRK